MDKTSLSKVLTSSKTAKTATTITSVDVKHAPAANAQEQAEENHDFELFMQKARQEEEKRQKAALQAAKELERRRMNSSMDPWASKLGKV